MGTWFHVLIKELDLSMHHDTRLHIDLPLAIQPRKHEYASSDSLLVVEWESAFSLLILLNPTPPSMAHFVPTQTSCD